MTVRHLPHCCKCPCNANPSAGELESSSRIGDVLVKIMDFASADKLLGQCSVDRESWIHGYLRGDWWGQGVGTALERVDLSSKFTHLSLFPIFWFPFLPFSLTCTNYMAGIGLMRPIGHQGPYAEIKERIFHYLLIPTIASNSIHGVAACFSKVGGGGLGNNCDVYFHAGKSDTWLWHNSRACQFY